MTDFLGGGIGSFYYHKQDLAAGGYNYKGYIHRTGVILITREEISSGNMLYARGTFGDFDTTWTNRASLTYVQISSI